MMLLTKEIRNKLPPLYANEKKSNDQVNIIVKFFCPWNQWTWYATEFDGEDIFFGFVEGFESELGNFSLIELGSITGMGGLKIERDIHYGYDHTLAEVMQKYRTYRQ